MWTRQRGQITGEYSPFEIIVAAGALDALSAPTEQRYDVTKIVPNISYTGFVSGSSSGLGHIYDIGILALEQAITTLPPAQVLPLAQFDSKLSKGMDVTIEGYGLYDSAMTLNGQLYIAKTPYQQRSDAEFIAGAPGSPDTCLGDSGGPAYLAVEGTMYLVGITSRGVPPDPNQCGNGAIYTIVSSYETWLHDNTGGAYPPAPQGSSGSSGPPGVSGCACKVGYRPSSSGQGLWMGLGIALLVSRLHRRSRSSHALFEPIGAARAPTNDRV